MVRKKDLLYSLDGEYENLTAAHCLLMAIEWSVLSPLAICAAGVYRHEPWWFKALFFLHLATGLLTLISFALIEIRNFKWGGVRRSSLNHSIFANIAVAVGFILIFGGLLRPVFDPHDEETQARYIWRQIHTTLGVAVTVGLNFHVPGCVLYG
eukprot:UN04141